MESNSELFTSEIETVSEETTEEISTEEIETVSEETTEEISTEEILEVESSEIIAETVSETVVYTTDPMVVPCLQMIICILCVFLIYGICKVIYKFLDSLFII